MMNLKVGDIVVRKRTKERVAVVSVDGNFIEIRTNSSEPVTCIRSDITLPLDQTPAPIPMRFYLPFGVWTCADGREVLFNRNYRPILTRLPGQAAVIAHGSERVPKIAEARFYQDDYPWDCSEVRRRCEAVLAAWGFARWTGEGLPEAAFMTSPETLTAPDWASLPIAA